MGRVEPTGFWNEWVESRDQDHEDEQDTRYSPQSDLWRRIKIVDDSCKANNQSEASRSSKKDDSREPIELKEPLNDTEFRARVL